MGGCGWIAQLLVALLEANPALMSDAAGLSLAPRFFAFLVLEHTNNNVHNVRLCRMIVAAEGVVDDAALREHHVAEKVRNCTRAQDETWKWI